MIVRFPNLKSNRISSESTSSFSMFQANQSNLIKKKEFEEEEISDSEEDLEGLDLDQHLFSKHPEKYEVNGTDGEVFLTNDGGLGNFGVYGSSVLRPGVWYHLTFIGEMDSSSCKVLVNGNPSSTIFHNSFSRITRNGMSFSRLSVKPNEMRVFGSRHPTRMFPLPIHVRLVAFWDRAVPENELKDLVLRDKLVKPPCLEEFRNLNRLFFSSESSSPAPLWQDPYFLSTFADVGESSDGEVDRFVSTYVRFLEMAILERENNPSDLSCILHSFTSSDITILRDVLRMFQNSILFIRNYSLSRRRQTEVYIERYLFSLQKSLKSLGEGSSILIPVSIGLSSF
jgi:hypothetical protein